MNGEMRAAARELGVRAVLTFATGAQVSLDGTQVLGFRISEGADSALLPGNVLSAQYEVDLANDEGQWRFGGALRGERPLVQATVQLVVSVGEKELPCGVFVVDGARADERGGKICLSGSDSIASELSGAFEDAVEYPAALSDVWRALVGQTRYEWSGELPNGDAVIDAAPDWNGATLRRAAGWIAQAAGCFVRVDRQGALEVVPCVGGAEAVLTAEDCLSMTDGFGGYGPVTGLRVTPAGSEEAVELSDGIGEMICVEGNPLFQAGAAGLDGLMRGMLDTLKGLELYRMEFTWRGDPALGVGALVSLEDTAGGVMKGVVTRQTLCFEDGFTAACSCGTPDAGDAGVMRAITPEGGVNAGALVGTVDGGLLAAGSVTARAVAAGSITAEKIAAGAVVADSIAADAVTTEKIAAGAVAADSIAADAVTTEKIAAGAVAADSIAADAVTAEKIAAGAVTAAALEAGSVDAEKIAVGSITADRLKAYLITADSALIADGAIGTAQIADGSITSAKVVELNADVITAGTLSAERLVIVGDDGLIYRINASSAGLSASELTEDQYRNYLNGTVIVAKSVTAAQIAAQTITGNEIAANAIKAANIDVVELFASEATIAQLNAADISGNQSLKLAVSSAVEAVEDDIADLDVRVTANESSIRLLEDEIVLKVSEADYNDDMTALTTRVTTAESKIEQKADSIELSVLRTEFDAMEIGGRNLLIGTQNDEWQAFSTSGSLYYVRPYTQLSAMGVSEGDTLCYSMGLKADVPMRLRMIMTTAASDIRVSDVYGDYVAAGEGRAWVTAEVPADAQYVRMYISSGSVDAASAYWKGEKLEKGSRATDWTPAPEDPATSLVTGTTVTITDEEFNVQTKQATFNIIDDSTGENEELVRIDSDGLTAQEGTFGTIHSDSVVPTQAAASFTPANAGEMQAVLDGISDHFLLGDVYVNAVNVTGGSFSVKGLCGGGQLVIQNGTVNALSVRNCQARVRIYSTVFSTSSTALDLYCANVYLNAAELNANVGATLDWSQAVLNNCTGTCTTLGKSSFRSELRIAGSSLPYGAVEANGGEIYSPLAFTDPPSAVETPTVTSVSLPATTTKTWGGSWLSGNALYQGRTGSNTLRRGCMWFDLSAISGKTIIGATLTLKRYDGIGGGGSVAVNIYGTTTASASGTPAVGTKYTSVSLANGATKSVDVTGAVQALADGTIKGLMIYDTQTGTFSGKTYTYGYCKLYGSDQSAKPVLNVTYK